MLHANVTSLARKAKPFGDYFRDRAKTVFEEDMRNYEIKHPDLSPSCDAGITKGAKKAGKQ